MSIQEAIQTLAQQLGVAAEHVWAVLTLQGVVEGGFGVFLILLSLAIAYQTKKFWASSKKSTTYDEQEFFLFISCMAGAVAASLFVIGAIRAKYLFNPEYYALKQVFDLLGS